MLKIYDNVTFYYAVFKASRKIPSKGWGFNEMGFEAKFNF